MISLNELFLSIGRTAFLFLLPFFCAFPCAVVLGYGSTLPRKLIFPFLIRLYVTLFRSSPLLVQFFLFYYGISTLPVVRENVFLWAIFESAYSVALVTLFLSSLAYMTEIVRTCLYLIPRSEILAAQAFSLTKKDYLLKIIFPNILNTGKESFQNEAIGLLKATSLASTITVMELTAWAQNGMAATFNPFLYFGISAVIYFILVRSIGVLFRLKVFFS